MEKPNKSEFIKCAEMILERFHENGTFVVGFDADGTAAVSPDGYTAWESDNDTLFCTDSPGDDPKELATLLEYYFDQEVNEVAA